MADGVEFAEIARGVRADKRPFFAELAKTQGNRFERAMSGVLAELVLCKIDSAFAEKKCAELRKESSRTFSAFPVDARNRRLVLRSLSAVLAGAKNVLPTKAMPAVERIQTEIGTVIATDFISDEAATKIVNSLNDEKELLAEFGQPNLVAYQGLIDQVSDWLKKPTVTSTPTIFAGKYVFCEKKQGQLECFGFNSYGQLNPPEFRDFKTAAIGSDISCAIDGTEVKCWGAEGSPIKKNIPALKNPYALTIGSNEACALDDSGLQCWGLPSSKNVGVGLSDPTEIDAEQDFACVLNAGRLICRGPDWKEREPITLLNPRALQVHARSVCLVDDNGPKCWAYDGYVRNRVPAEAANATDVVRVGDFQVCWSEASAFKCNSNYREVTPFSFKTQKVKEIAAGDSFLCVKGEGTTECLGDPRLEMQRTAPAASSSAHSLNVQSGCFLDQGQLKCWGENAQRVLYASERIQLPDTKFFAIQAGLTTLCVSDGTRIQCKDIAGHGRSKTYSVPSLKNIREFNAGPGGGGGFCALDDDGLHCWDGGGIIPERCWPMSTDINSTLKNPQQLRMVYGPCLLDEGIFRCWREFFEEKDGAFAVPSQVKLADPTILTTNDRSWYKEVSLGVIDREGVKVWRDVWGTSREWGAKWAQIHNFAHVFRNPRKLLLNHSYEARSIDYFCTLDDEGVQCWNHQNQPMAVPKLSHPRELDWHRGNLCALHDGGVRCWNYWGSER